jgi:hypothetical protein
MEKVVYGRVFSRIHPADYRDAPRFSVVPFLEAAADALNGQRIHFTGVHAQHSLRRCAEIIDDEIKSKHEIFAERFYPHIVRL